MTDRPTVITGWSGEGGLVAVADHRMPVLDTNTTITARRRRALVTRTCRQTDN